MRPLVIALIALTLLTGSVALLPEAAAACGPKVNLGEPSVSFSCTAQACVNTSCTTVKVEV